MFNLLLVEEKKFYSCVLFSMSFRMSAATKRKHVVKEVLDDFVLPEGDQQIVKVT